VSLRRAISTADGKQRYVRQLFATIADRYDFITGFLSYGQDRRWKRRLIQLARIQPSDVALDLACGTGDIVCAAAPRVQRAVGLDVTHRMLQLAKRRAADGYPAKAGLYFVTGDMLALPFSDQSFTVVTVGYGLRNVPDLQRSLREIRRVTAPRGRVLSLDFNRPSNALVRSVYLLYLTVVGSALGWVLHRDPNTYRYIPESIRTYPGAEGVRRMMEETGFVDVRVERVLGGLMAIHHATAPASAPAPA
jgi:demethylmenaquinone methyltransferase/2-methoxy-6-polyprenyl-1,4-benzoquinol methylase